MKYFILALKNAFDFNGRTTRTEFWSYYLVAIIIYFIIFTIQNFLLLDPNLLYLISFCYGAIILVPTVSCMVRRLHDTNKSGLFVIVSLIPGIGTILLFCLLALPTYNIDNRYDY